MTKVLYRLSASTKRFLAFIYDSLFAAILFPLSIAIRFDSFENIVFQKQIFIKTIIVLLVHQLVFSVFSQYKGIWRYASMHDLKQIIKATTIGVILSILALYFFNQIDYIPRTSFIIYWSLNIIFISGGRFVYRLFKDLSYSTQGDNCLIIGAGNAGNQLIKSIKYEANSNLNVVAIIDDDKSKHKRMIHGCPIIGSTDDISMAIDKYDIKIVIIAIPSASSKEIRQILSKIPIESSVQTKILPTLSQLVSSEIDISLIKDVDPIDLLGRRPIQLDLHEIEKMVSNQNILVTGAAGSIGSELCRQVARFNPKRVVLFDISEFGLYELERKLSSEFPNVSFMPAIGSVCDKDRVNEIFSLYKFNVLFHAAAFKHVPLMESSAKECIKNNIFGTQTIAQAARNSKIKHFVLISTDKAVNPTNIMGASKRVAEMICQHEGQASSETLFTVVRFGNVLGSNGSVIPLFKEQVKNGGPITVTHKEITRYFMSIPEACQLVLQAVTMGRGRDIFVLEMGEPVKIVTLAEDLIKLSGLRPYKDIDIVFTGLRPGEKLHEELFNASEMLDHTCHKLVKKANASELDPKLADHLNELHSSINIFNNFQAKKYIQKIVTGFNIDEENEIELRVENNVH